jgi:hypothetical protein
MMDTPEQHPDGASQQPPGHNSKIPNVTTGVVANGSIKLTRRHTLPAVLDGGVERPPPYVTSFDSFRLRPSGVEGADGSTEGHSTAPRTRRLSVSDISYGSTSSHSVGTCGSDGFSGALSDGSPVRETNSGSLYCESTAAAGHGNGHHVPASSSCCDSQLSHPLSVSR